jgi:hypothetical protein
MFLILLTFAFAIARVFDIYIPEGIWLDSFKAMAHIFVGFLFGASYISLEHKAFYLDLAVGLSLVEFICFLVSLL